jgi:flagellar protein FlaG
MSSDISIGGVGRASASDNTLSANIGQRASASSEGVSPSRTSSSSSTDTYDIHSEKDLKLAELQGKNIAVGDQELIKAIEKANKAIQGITTTFEFKIHEATKQIMVKVLNKETGETVREIPPEKILDMVASMWEKAGILIDQRR